MTQPMTELDSRYSSVDAEAAPWATAVRLLEDAEVFWLTTIRPEGRPHVTPLIAVWLDDALHFCTGDEEQKSRNLRHTRACVLSTGCNTLSGIDVVVDGDAEAVTDDQTLARLAERFATKYDDAWGFRVDGGRFVGHGGPATVYRVQPRTAYGFGKSPFHHTRWTF